MTLAQLEAIYKANIDIGHLEALEAVYVHGYYNGAGTSIGASTPVAGVVSGRTAPTTTLKFSKPDQR
ncbi:MAG TPA: hypothetical protein VGS04_05105 [Nitrososphaerales archaeon]|nr:hypothetical protein [Nitrososphaerales archaeon]